MMKIKSSLHDFAICKDENHKNHLISKSAWTSEEAVYHLHLVTLQDLTPRFVLAANEDDAASQATCGDRATVLGVKQVPLRIRGWGQNEF